MPKADMRCLQTANDVERAGYWKIGYSGLTRTAVTRQTELVH
jgi:hypothetical protein